MTAVEDLHALVVRDGYTQADIDALLLCAANGMSAEQAATVVLTAIRRGADPLVTARTMLRLRAAARGGAM